MYKEILTVSEKDIESLPAFLTQKQFRQQVFHISENKFLELLRQEGVPKIMIGRKILIPVRKMLEYLTERVNLKTKKEQENNNIKGDENMNQNCKKKATVYFEGVRKVWKVVSREFKTAQGKTGVLTVTAETLIALKNICLKRQKDQFKLHRFKRTEEVWEIYSEMIEEVDKRISETPPFLVDEPAAYVAPIITTELQPVQDNPLGKVKRYDALRETADLLEVGYEEFINKIEAVKTLYCVSIDKEGEYTEILKQLPKTIREIATELESNEKLKFYEELAKNVQATINQIEKALEEPKMHLKIINNWQV